VAFIDDYTAWVVGLSAASNRERIQKVIDKALAWEKRSGATFEGSKTVIQHFTRDSRRTDTLPFRIKGQEVVPKEEVKVLGVVLDSGLRYKKHIANAATRGLRAAMALKRLRLLSPSISRRLFGATVAPVIDYASSVWTHACRTGDIAALNRVQKVGAQAVTGMFRTVAAAVGEAEASLRTTLERHFERALKLWINMQTLPDTHPLRKHQGIALRRFMSPMQRIATKWKHINTDRMETIQAYTMAPWESRIAIVCIEDRGKAAEVAEAAQGLRIATSASARHGIIGVGIAIRDTEGETPQEDIAKYAVTL